MSHIEQLTKAAHNRKGTMDNMELGKAFRAAAREAIAADPDAPGSTVLAAAVRVDESVDAVMDTYPGVATACRMLLAATARAAAVGEIDSDTAVTAYDKLNNELVGFLGDLTGTTLKDDPRTDAL